MLIEKKWVEPPVAELLDVDREYREKSRAILHTRRGGRRYTAALSNTAPPDQEQFARECVVLSVDDDTDRRYTVLTVRRGPLRGRRLVAGREAECVRHLAEAGEISR